MKNKLDAHLEAYQGNNIYDYDNKIQLEWYPKRIASYAKGANSLLELGLGHGITVNVFNQYFERHVVIDASPAVISNYKKNNPEAKVQIIESFFETFDTDERFDIIVFGYILEHVDNPIEILKKFKKFLAEKGKVFVTVPNAEVLNRKLGHIAGMLPDMEELSEHDLLLGHKRYYTVESLKDDIHKAGYSLKRIEGIYLKPFTTRQMLSLSLDEKIINALCVQGVDYPELSCGILAELVLNN